MKAHLDCIPCFQQQALRSARAAGADESTQKAVLREALKLLFHADWNQTPMHTARPIHKLVRRVTGVDDPHAELKATSNAAAFAFYEEAKRRVEESPDPLKTAARFAIAGNIMDYGALAEFDLGETLERAASVELAADDLNRLRADLDTADSVLYFADNAGEIVFDRLLIETIRTRRPAAVSLVVKSGPFINDASRAEAESVGLADLPGVTLLEVDNGDGNAPDYASADVGRWIEQHDVVISKGQGNYEALSEYVGVYYLLMIKCPAVARETGLPERSIVLQYR